MKPESVKAVIIKTLEGRGWLFEGPLCREVHEITLSKEAIIGRRCRELAKAGILVKQYEQVGPKHVKSVMYKIADKSRWPSLETMRKFKQEHLDNLEKQRIELKLL